MKEDNILIAGIEDKIEQSMERYMVTNSSFLDIRQRTLAERVCRKYQGLRYTFYGGYEDAERTVALILPEYATEEDHPLAVLSIIQNGKNSLTHRDYLGSLLGLGVKREAIGDILVRDQGADVVILKEMEEFFLYHYEKAGRASLRVEVKEVKEIIVPEGRTEEKRDTVASLRIDSLIASSFGLSRTKASAAVEGGLVLVNGLVTIKSDRQIKEGDKLVLRGKGKVVLKSVGSVTKKDRYPIVIQKFL